MDDKDKTIDALWERSNHGTQREDVVRAYEAGQAAERLTCGDYFTHDRTGVRFVCRSVTRHDYGSSVPMLRAEIEPAPK